jgi:hypothetical protein
MEYNGILYKHIHRRLIDKELFVYVKKLEMVKEKQDTSEQKSHLY